jgi:myxalamid-type polyketide synthase MxaE and MxaD
VGDLDSPRLLSMLAPKIEGARLLDALTRDCDLDFFVLFSSTTALWGVAGLGHYAAANEYLDAFARARAAQGRPALSINWGTWEEMRLATEADRKAFMQSGLNPMGSADALDRLGRLIGAGVHRKVVAAVDWSILKPLYETKRVRPFLAEVGALPSAARGGDRADAGAGTRPAAVIVQQLASAAPEQRQDLLVSYLRDQVASVLGLPDPQSISLSQGLFEMGMDSLMSVELKNRLESGLEHPLPSTLTFNYPNIAALAAFLDGELNQMHASEAATATAAPAPVVPSGDLDELTDDELEARLLARLEQSR